MPQAVLSGPGQPEARIPGGAAARVVLRGALESEPPRMRDQHGARRGGTEAGALFVRDPARTLSC